LYNASALFADVHIIGMGGYNNFFEVIVDLRVMMDIK
jgi:hypothetical protein